MTQEEMVWMARQSPNVFATLCLGLNQSWCHKRLQKHLTDNDDALVEIGRGHGKTTQLSLRCAFEIGRDPAVRIKYIQQNDKEASKTVAQTLRIIKSDQYRAIFPWIIVDPRKESSSRFQVNIDQTIAAQVMRENAQIGGLTLHPNESRDATMEGHGVFGRAGGRVDILIIDDPTDLKTSIMQPALRSAVDEYVNNNWMPMRDYAGGRQIRTWRSGTIYHTDDVIGRWRARMGDSEKRLFMPCVGTESPWPEVYTPERMESIREEIGPIAYARAYELRPASNDNTIFYPEWLFKSLYESIPKDHVGQSVVAVDFAFTTKSYKSKDPDYSTAVVANVSRTGHVYIVDFLRTRSHFPEFVAQLLTLCRKHRVSQGFGESVAAQSELVRQLNRFTDIPFVGIPRKLDKVTRATNEQAKVESGRLHLPGISDEDGMLVVNPRFRVMFDELTAFPYAGHDDLVDPIVDLLSKQKSLGGTMMVSRFENHRKDVAALYGQNNAQKRPTIRR